jgi:hypothetical protein
MCSVICLLWRVPVCPSSSGVLEHLRLQPRLGNGINWKGQIFPHLRNYTEVNKMTGVGNALKRHYQVYLEEYEKVGDGWRQVNRQ